MSTRDDKKLVLADEKPVLVNDADLARIHELLKGHGWKETQWPIFPNSSGKMAVLVIAKEVAK